MISQKIINGVGYSQYMESPKMEPTITMTRQRLQIIDISHLSLRMCVYISDIDDEATARIVNASVAFSVCSV